MAKRVFSFRTRPRLLQTAVWSQTGDKVPKCVVLSIYFCDLDVYNNLPKAVMDGPDTKKLKKLLTGMARERCRADGSQWFTLFL